MRAGKTLVLLDNAPSGLRPGVDYLAVSSADNFGLGAIAAELASPYVTNEGVAGILNYEAEFFVTNEREIAFRKWMSAERPDVTLVEGGSPKSRMRATRTVACWRRTTISIAFRRLGRAGAESPVRDPRRREGAPDRHGRSRQRDRRRTSLRRTAQGHRGATALRPGRGGGGRCAARVDRAAAPAWISSTGLKVTRESLRESSRPFGMRRRAVTTLTFDRSRALGHLEARSR